MPDYLRLTFLRTESQSSKSQRHNSIKEQNQAHLRNTLTHQLTKMEQLCLYSPLPQQYNTQCSFGPPRPSPSPPPSPSSGIEARAQPPHINTTPPPNNQQDPRQDSNAPYMQTRPTQLMNRNQNDQDTQTQPIKPPAPVPTLIIHTYTPFVPFASLPSQPKAKKQTKKRSSHIHHREQKSKIKHHTIPKHTHTHRVREI